MVEKYNKLVRDKIPQIISEKGDCPKVALLDDAQFEVMLNQKLQEEVAEYFENYDVDELADIMEVIYALAQRKGVTKNDLEHIRANKFAERGGFNDKVLLIEVNRS